jgi:hypothetical protein
VTVKPAVFDLGGPEPPSNSKKDGLADESGDGELVDGRRYLLGPDRAKPVLGLFTGDEAGVPVAGTTARPIPDHHSSDRGPVG